MPDDNSPPDDDKFRPDAIAARIDKLGSESESDRLAREEERKLLERKSHKGGLETAASRRLAKIGERKVKRPSTAADAVSVDPMGHRLASLQSWMRKHQALAAGIGIAAVAAIGAGVGVAWWHQRREEQSSVLLSRAMADEHGHLASGKDEGDDETPAKELYPTFKTAAARRDAALAEYRTVQAKFPGTGAAILARLAEGSLLLDGGDAKGAGAAYDEVARSALAAADAEVRGRALEGKGFASELLAQADSANRDKHLDEAMVDYKALEAVDGDFMDLGAYHQARLLAEKGDRTKAIEILKDLDKRLSAPEHAAAGYLQLVVEDRLRDLDPTALPPKSAKTPAAMGDLLGGGPGGGPNHVDMSDPKIQELIRQLQQQQHQEQQGAPPSPPGSAP